MFIKGIESINFLFLNVEIGMYIYIRKKIFFLFLMLSYNKSEK